MRKLNRILFEFIWKRRHGRSNINEPLIYNGTPPPPTIPTVVVYMLPYGFITLDVSGTGTEIWTTGLYGFM